MTASAAVLAVALAGAFPPPNSRDAPVALAAADARVPGVSWQGQALAADFDYDGVGDVAMLGAEGQDAVVAVVVGPVRRDARVITLRFRELRPDAQGALCGPAREATLSVEAPAFDPEAVPGTFAAALEASIARANAVGGKGLRLDDARCDALHVLFDGARFVAWRR